MVIASEIEEKVSLISYLKGGKILVTDDMTMMRKTIKNILRHLGVQDEQIIEAANGEDALNLLRDYSETVRFVLLDWNMPRLAGIQALKIMKSEKELQHIPVLMVTAENNENFILEAIENKAEGYLVKPFVSKTLEEKIINIINPPSYIKLIKKGEEFFKQGEYEKALTIFQDVLKTKPESSGIRLLIGRVHESLKNDEKALQFYNEAVDKNPQFLRAHKTLAKFYMNKGDKKSALKSFENAVKISPTNANRQLMIGKIALEVDKDKHKAEKAFEAAAKQAPELTKEIAEVYLSNGCPQKAENFFRDSLANEESVPLYNRLGIALRKQGKWGKAIEEYQKALKVEPNNETVFFNMGMAYIDGNKIDCDKKQDALKCLKMALKIRPDFKEAKEKLNNLLKVKSK